MGKPGRCRRRTVDPGDFDICADRVGNSCRRAARRGISVPGPQPARRGPDRPVAAHRVSSGQRSAGGCRERTASGLGRGYRDRRDRPRRSHRNRDPRSLRTAARNGRGSAGRDRGRSCCLGGATVACGHPSRRRCRRDARGQALADATSPGRNPNAACPDCAVCT